MIETLISSKTRIKLLLKFFLNSSMTAYLRNLESEFGESSNSIRVELNRLEDAGFLSSEFEGNKKIFRANTRHPLFGELNSIVMKYAGIDRIIEHVVKCLGDVEEVYLTGEFARGLDSKIVDLILIGNIDTRYLVELIEKAEPLIHRKIRYLIYSKTEFEKLDFSNLTTIPLLLWSKKH
ncbi:MAG: winged helix-turn-helix domain-containing protein [Bacteroidia bacterium]